MFSTKRYRCSDSDVPMLTEQYNLLLPWYMATLAGASVYMKKLLYSWIYRTAWRIYFAYARDRERESEGAKNKPLTSHKPSTTCRGSLALHTTTPAGEITAHQRCDGSASSSRNPVIQKYRSRIFEAHPPGLSQLALWVARPNSRAVFVIKFRLTAVTTSL